MTKKYIDADLLRKEIERRKNNAPLHYHPHACTSVISELEELLASLDSLQQEQQEVDLEKEMEKFGERWPYPASFDGYDKDWVDELTEECAKHFYELGKKAMREQMLKDAIYYVVQDDLDSHGASYNIPFIRIGTTALKPKGIGVGDKVKVIVLKAEE